MNLHPVLVHFPVALLTMYAVLELASLLKPVRARAYVFQVKSSMLLLGALAAIPTYVTGYIQLAAVLPDNPIYRAIQMHYRFATATLIIFGVLALGYAAEWLTREWLAMPASLKNILGKVRIVSAIPLAPLLALLGLASVTITGALGGGMVYGPDVDPAVKFIYQLLVK